MDCYIKENSPIARIAAAKLRAEAAAIVIGRTIHLYNASRAEFLSNRRWVNHELVHIRQFRRHGFLPFIARYLWESMQHGYRNNKYEIEARQGERDDRVCEGLKIIG